MVGEVQHAAGCGPRTKQNQTNKDSQRLRALPPCAPHPHLSLTHTHTHTHTHTRLLSRVPKQEADREQPQNAEAERRELKYQPCAEELHIFQCPSLLLSLLICKMGIRMGLTAVPANIRERRLYALKEFSMSFLVLSLDD